MIPQPNYLGEVGEPPAVPLPRQRPWWHRWAAVVGLIALGAFVGGFVGAMSRNGTIDRAHKATAVSDAHAAALDRSLTATKADLTAARDDAATQTALAQACAGVGTAAESVITLASQGLNLASDAIGADVVTLATVSSELNVLVPQMQDARATLDAAEASCTG